MLNEMCNKKNTVIVESRLTSSSLNFGVDICVVALCYFRFIFLLPAWELRKVPLPENK